MLFFTTPPPEPRRRRTRRKRRTPIIPTLLWLFALVILATALWSVRRVASTAFDDAMAREVKDAGDGESGLEKGVGAVDAREVQERAEDVKQNMEGATGRDRDEETVENRKGEVNGTRRVDEIEAKVSAQKRDAEEVERPTERLVSEESGRNTEKVEQVNGEGGGQEKDEQIKAAQAPGLLAPEVEEAQGDPVGEDEVDSLDPEEGGEAPVITLKRGGVDEAIEDEAEDDADEPSEEGRR